MTTSSILIVEDDRDIAELIRFHIEREGYHVTESSSGREALDLIRKQRPELVILDLMLPDLDGLEICRRMKWDDRTRSIPVLIVSAKGDEADVVTGLELGADDYVSKPFSPRVLMARVKNILRRGSASDVPESDSRERSTLSLADGDLIIDIDQHKVFMNGMPLEFTLTEFGILHYLAKRPGFVRTRDQIISAVHGSNIVLSSRTVDVHVTAIRRKLASFGQLIQTVRGVGYRLTEQLPASTA